MELRAAHPTAFQLKVGKEHGELQEDLIKLITRLDV